MSVVAQSGGASAPGRADQPSGELGSRESRVSGCCRLQPYPAMKDSGVEWLGEVPEHWEVSPHRALFTEVKDSDHPEEQMLSVTIRRGVIRQRALLADSSNKDSSRQDKSAYKLVRPGDIAYNKMRAWQGALGMSKYRGIVSPAYVVQRPRSVADACYFHYLLRTPAFAKEAERWSYGITSDMWSLRPEHFKMIYACLPPLPEQTAIARFLDHVDRRIRRYIRAKQKLIKLLEEQKQAIVHCAVTRGLDPNVHLKDSGAEWLGEVPEHWEVRRLKSLVHRIEQGVSPQAESYLADGDAWGVLKAGCVNRGEFRERTQAPSFEFCIRSELGCRSGRRSCLTGKWFTTSRWVSWTRVISSLQADLVRQDISAGVPPGCSP